MKLLIFLLLIIISCEKKAPAPKVIKKPELINNIKKVNTLSDEEKAAWRSRNILYRSDSFDETLFQVRVHTKGDKIRYLFLGLTVPQDSSDKSQMLRIYEYSDDDGLFVVDLSRIKKMDSKLFNTSTYSDYFADMRQRNYDNLHISNDSLFYYKERVSEIDSVSLYGIERDYFVYKIGSCHPGTPISEEMFLHSNPRKSINSMETFLYSPDNSSVAYCSIYDIEIYHLTEESPVITLNWPDKMYSGDDAIKDAPRIVNVIANFPNADDLDDCDESALFGGMSWNPNEEIIYFDNSGFCYACIWQMNIKTGEVKKLVSVHEAIHPYYFEYLDEAYLCYVQNNEIRKVSLSKF